MWFKIAITVGLAALKEIFSGWLSRWKQKKEVQDAVEPYKKELAIKSKPAGDDNSLVDRL